MVRDGEPVARLRDPAPAASDKVVIPREDIPHVAKAVANLYALAVPGLVRALGGKGADDPLGEDEKEAVRTVLDLYARVRWEFLAEKHAPEVLLCIGLGTPIIMRLQKPGKTAPTGDGGVPEVKAA